ncbi:hypothetical protein AKJ09_03346 [Labilithrix luteola]|uniref:Uncharacterized protein n=1 Tax=Labilithrix luteola TaxID=1391654 RepID=A0A0K1PT36_9BACT|nr:hypothetical protein AKJ09_03346 [Labilithrix luteola]
MNRVAVPQHAALCNATRRGVPMDLARTWIFGVDGSDFVFRSRVNRSSCGTSHA